MKKNHVSQLNGNHQITKAQPLPHYTYQAPRPTCYTASPSVHPTSRYGDELLYSEDMSSVVRGGFMRKTGTWKKEGKKGLLCV